MFDMNDTQLSLIMPLLSPDEIIGHSINPDIFDCINRIRSAESAVIPSSIHSMLVEISDMIHHRMRTELVYADKAHLYATAISMLVTEEDMFQYIDRFMTMDRIAAITMAVYCGVPKEIIKALYTDGKSYEEMESYTIEWCNTGKVDDYRVVRFSIQL